MKFYTYKVKKINGDNKFSHGHIIHAKSKKKAMQAVYDHLVRIGDPNFPMVAFVKRIK